MWDNILNTGLFRDALISAVPALICITIHEVSHGFTAYKLGDSTAKDMGRLTLNPVKHIDVFGLLMIVLVGFGWAKPVPVDMKNFKRPKWGMALVAFAGPLSNLIMAMLVMIIFMLLPEPYGGEMPFLIAFSQYADELPIITLIIHRFIIINVMLAIFNLLPIPPLDGSKMFFSLLPANAYYTLMKYERFGMIFLILIILSGRYLSFDLFNIIIAKPAVALLFYMADIAQRAVSIFM